MMLVKLGATYAIQLNVYRTSEQMSNYIGAQLLSLLEKIGKLFILRCMKEYILSIGSAGQEDETTKGSYDS